MTTDSSHSHVKGSTSSKSTSNTSLPRVDAALADLEARVTKLEGGTPPAPPPPPPPPPPDGWTFGADEDGTFTAPAGSLVRYGAGTTYVTKALSGLVACNNATFGDPAVGITKHCDYQPNTNPPPPPPPPATGAVYGPAIYMDSLGNTTVRQGENNYYRFRQHGTSPVKTCLVYIIANGNTGYSNGTGGKYRITFQTVDANGFPTGTIVATAPDFTPGNPATKDFPTITFPAYTPVDGQLYAMVWVDVDASPNTNYISLDGVSVGKPVNPRMPKYPNTDWGWGYSSGSSWTERTTQVPILDIGYANGTHQGVGYMEVSYSGDWGVISGTKQLRETFTVSGGDRSVSSVGIWMSRTSGTDPLTITLETGAGLAVASATVPAASIPIATQLNGSEVKASFTAVSLISGQIYRLRLSTPATSSYGLAPIRKGVSYGFNPATYFSEGVAEKTSGAAWASAGRVAGENDLPFYLK